MNKKIFNTLRTSAFVVAAFAICAFTSNEAQAQFYGGGVGVGVGVGYGGGVRVNVGSFRPAYGYYNRPYYVAPRYGYRPVVLPVVRSVVVRPVVRTVARPFVYRPYVYRPGVRYRW